MIISKAEQEQGGNLIETADYIKDAKNAAPGEAHGPKCAFIGTVGGLTGDWDQTQAEMGTLETEWKAHRQGGSTGKAFVHWSISLKPGEGPWTPEKAREAVEIHMRHQGLEGHHALYGVHKDRPHSHINLYVCMIRPVPDEKGIYRLAWQGASVESAKGNNKAESAQKAEAEICARQGWERVKRAHWDYVDGEFVPRRPAPKDPDAVNVGVKIRGKESRMGEVHPKTLLAEAGRDLIRAAAGDKAQAIAALAAAGIIYSDTDYVDKQGRRHVGGLLTSNDVPKGVKVSSLPKDCKWIVAQPDKSASPKTASEKPIKIEGFADAKAVVKQAVKESGTWTELHQKIDAAGCSFERTGKTGGRIRYGQGETDVIKLSEAGTSFSRLEQKLGQFSPYAGTMHDGQGKVNASFEKMHGEAVEPLGDNSIGRLPAYTVSESVIAEPLGDNAIGRIPAYTMPENFHATGGQDAIEHAYTPIPTIAEAATAVFMAQGQTEAEVLASLESQGISFTREVATDRKTGKEFTYGKLARGDEAISLKALGQNAEGKPLVTLSGLDRGFLAAEASRVLTAHAAEGRMASAAALAAAGIVLSEAKATTKDGKEVTYGQLERNGVVIPLSALGRDEKGHSTYSLSALDRTELRNLALPIVEAHAAQGRTATAEALAAQGITLTERKEVIEKDGQKTEIRFGEIERNGVTVSLKALAEKDGKAIHSLGSLERTEREIRQGDLRAEALPVAEAHARQGWDAMVKALAAKDIRLSEEPTIIKKDGKETEVVFARLERDGISVSLKSLGEKDGRALFQARELERRGLATDAAKILDAHGTYAGAEKALAQAGINAERVRTTYVAPDGEEKQATVLRLERNGVTTSSGYAGKAYGVSSLDNRYMPETTAKALYMEARTHRDPVKFLASRGLTASDVDRIGRVGAKVEKGLPRNSAPPAAPVQPGGSVIPRSVKELLDSIAEAAEAAAKVAQANARASRAEAEKRKAEKALAALQGQIKQEEKKQPARPASAGAQAAKPEVNNMAEGMNHAPVATKPAPVEAVEEKQEQAKPVVEDQQQAAQAQAQAQEAPKAGGTTDAEKDRLKADADREREREQEQREREIERERMMRERERERMRM